MRRFLLSVLVLLASAPLSLHAQVWKGPGTPGCVGPGCTYPVPAPLLYTRIIGPEGSNATFIQGGDVRTLDAPVNVGLRPGYIYRFRLAGFEKHPRESLWPTIEVIGTLHMPKPLCAADHPAPVVFSDRDIERALSGAFITKVIYLEHPDKAVPVATAGDEPMETEIPINRDPVTEARYRGRPLMIVRFGGRQADPQEVACRAIPGTVLLPGDPSLGPPALPPYLPFQCMVPFDPILGPRPPEEECMHDGGDIGLRAALDGQGKLLGLDPSDTVAEYVDNCGRKRLAISNRVCLCVPRFAVLRTELLPVDFNGLLQVVRAEWEQPQAVVKLPVPPVTVVQREVPEVLKQRQRPAAVLEAVGPVILENLEASALLIGTQQGQMVIGTVPPKSCAPPCPLHLCKEADKKCAQIGDIVTFTLKYTNPGAAPITDVVVSDSLTGRFEYVAGSQKSDREAGFTTQANEAGSSILRWQVGGILQPGQSGTVSFQVRIR